MLETPTQVFSGGYCEIFKNTYFDFSNLIRFPAYNEKSQIHVAWFREMYFIESRSSGKIIYNLYLCDFSGWSL